MRRPLGVSTETAGWRASAGHAVARQPAASGRPQGHGRAATGAVLSFDSTVARLVGALASCAELRARDRLEAFPRNRPAARCAVDRSRPVKVFGRRRGYHALVPTLGADEGAGAGSEQFDEHFAFGPALGPQLSGLRKPARHLFRRALAAPPAGRATQIVIVSFAAHEDSVPIGFCRASRPGRNTQSRSFLRQFGQAPVATWLRLVGRARGNLLCAQSS